MNFAFAASAATWLTRESNSAAATRRGVKAYAAKQYGPAADDFLKANALRQTAATLFNLGTARIAAGKREEGSAALTQSMADRSFRADALYNRGNSALAANAYDYAIRDYSESLRIRPSDVAAKRNLEIALQRKAQAQQSQSGGESKGSQPNQEKSKQHGGGSGQNQQQPQQPKGDANADALLRAVQQQEQEELSRMKRAKMGKGRVGW